MNILLYIIIAAAFCITPAGVIWLCKRYSVLGKLGPIMVLYAVGMVFGNLPFMPSQIAPLQNILPNILIPLAIPMMLFGCKFSRNEARLQCKIVVSGFISVAIAVAIGYLFFGRHLEQGAEIGGIITGMYTGGTLNAAALQTIFRINSETYILINSYDIIISFIYFVFLFSVGIRAFRRLYKENTSCSQRCDEKEFASAEQSSPNPYGRILTKAGAKQMAQMLLVVTIVISISAGVAISLPEEWFMVVFILLLTTLGVACSFVKRIREMDLSYDVGMYLIYIFSMVIASMADFSNLNFEKGLNQLAFMTIAVFLSLTIHAILCRTMRVDADSMIISSVAFINSPPFVPMAAAAMRNKNAIVTGLGAGIVGYAAGNHLGVVMAELLKWF